jgi:predicted deacylase
MSSKPDWLDQGAGRRLHRIPVTRILSGELVLSLHVLTGRAEGPTLGLIAGVHGDEMLPPLAYKLLLDSLEPGEVAGRLAVLPVANPLALAHFDRQTPEQHGNTDLHTVFPGNREKGNLTNRIALTIQENLLDHLDAFVDFHCGGSGGRLQNRSDFDGSLEPDLKGRCLAMCRAFGAPFIHSGSLARSATSYVNARGVPTCNAEAGGAFLGPGPSQYYLEGMVRGLRDLMSHLGMLPGRPQPKPPRQMLFSFKSRYEANPSVGGFLQSNFQDPKDLGRLVKAGEVLGEVIDLHTLQTTEVLKAPVDGYLFFSRFSGAVDAGTKAFALAEEKGVEWLE